MMCHVVLAYDTATSIAVYSHAEAVDELPFPVSALLCSLSTFADQNGWILEHVGLEDSSMCYERGPSGLLWLMCTSNLLLQQQHMQGLLQTADNLVCLLLGNNICARAASLKQTMKGVGQYLDSLFSEQQPQLHNKLPFLPLALPHQTVLQPSAATAGLPKLLQDLATAADGRVHAAAVLKDGRYCCASPSWQHMTSWQLLVLQLAACHQGCTQQDDDGQVLLPGFSNLGTPSQPGAVKLQWHTLQAGLQLCALADSSYTQQDFFHNVQQAVKSHKAGICVEPLQLPGPLTAVALVDLHWITINTGASSDDTRNTSDEHQWWQQPLHVLGWQQQQEPPQSVILQSGSRTTAALPVGPGSSNVAVMAANRHIDLPEAELLLRNALPAALLLGA